MTSQNENYRIKGFAVINLFGTKNYTIDLNFKPNVSIIYGLNGTGKTTLLRMINDMLLFEFNDLEHISFESFELILRNNHSIKYKKGDIIEDSEIVFLSQDKESIDIWKPLSKVMTSPMIDRRKMITQEDLIKFYEYLRGEKKDEILANYFILNDDQSNFSARDLFFSLIDEYNDGILHFRINPYELLERIKSFLLDKKFPYPDWYSKLILANPIEFIESERLIRLSNKGEERNLEKRVINIYSRELNDLKKNAIKKFNEKTQILNSTFPKRVIEILSEKPKKPMFSSSELKKKIDNIRKNEERFIFAGLLTREHQKIPPSNTKNLDIEDIAKILSLWVVDLNEKYSEFEDLLNNIKIFENIINKGHLTDKKIKFDGEEGFYFFTDSGQNISGDMLSSGEQHIIVLFYFLLFKAKEYSIVLIDEPEISLHSIWQNNFIDDIIKIGEKKDLTFVLATHSPQIIHGRMSLIKRLESNKIS